MGNQASEPGDGPIDELESRGGAESSGAVPRTAREKSHQSAPRYAADDGRGASESSASKQAARANQSGVELLKQNQHEEAIRQFKTALQFEAGSVQILNNIGLAYAKIQDFASAYEWYEKAYDQDRSDVETLFSLAWVERKRARYPHAKELFQKVLELQPEHGKALYLLGDLLKSSRDFEGAIRYFERYVRLESTGVDGHISLAQCCEHAKQFQRAVELYNHVLRLDPSRSDVTYWLGRAHYHLQEYKQCIACFDRIPDSDKQAFEARSYGARACRAMEDRSSAIVYAERAAQLRQHADVFHFLGEEYLHRGDQSKAVHWFGLAIEKDPNHTLSLKELGHIMYRQQRFQEAEMHYTRCAELERQSATALKNLALVKFKLRKITECRQWCNATVHIDPLNADALWMLAELHKDTGEDKWFMNLRYPPEIAVADVCQTIAKGYLSRKLTTDALVWLQKVQNYSPSDARVKEALKLLTQQGASTNPQDVIDVLEQKWQPLAGDRQRLGGTAPSTSPGLARAGSSLVSSQTGTMPATQGYLSDSRQEVGSEFSIDYLEKLLRRAELAVSRGSGVDQWTELKVGARQVLQKRPNDSLALKCMARALLSTGGDVSEIKDYARRAAENSASDSSFTLGYELHCYLAAAHERDRDFVAAETHFTKALLSKPGDEIAQVGLARCLLQRSETAQARQIYEQVCAKYPNCMESHLRLGEMALKAGDYNNAYQWSSKANKIDPSNASVLVCLGQASAKLQRTDEAVRALDQGLSNNSSPDPTAMQVLAELQRRAGRDQEAIVWYKKLLDLRNGDYECTLNLAQLHAARGAAGASQALHYFRSALQCRPNTKETHMIFVQMTDVQSGIKNWKDAQQTLERATREFPDDAELWSKLLNVYGHLQDKPGQEKCQKKIAQFDNMSISKRIAYGDLLETQGQAQQARAQYEQVLRSDPGNIAAQLKLAWSYRQDTSQEKNLEEACRLYDLVLATSPNNPEALDGAAYCHRKLQNWETAVQLYQLSLKAKPMEEKTLYYLGDILYKQHRHAECQHYLTRLVDSNCSPEFMRSALYTLAKSNVSLDEYDKAEEYARRGLIQMSNHPHFLFMLALVKNRTAAYDESISTLHQALQHCDSSEERGSGNEMLRLEIRDWLAQAYERKGDYKAAMDQVDLALQQDPQHVSTLITKGLVQMKLKQLDQAESSFKKALSIEKNHALALVRWGYCRLLASDVQDAIQKFQLALQQRCGTVALPQSVKGVARIYTALCMMGQNDIQGALIQLSEAKKHHKNFREVCGSAKDAVVRGECDQLVAKIRSICDLDVNTAQAWQLVHLMAKELEIDMRDPKAPTSQALGSNAIAGKPDRIALGPRIEPRDGKNPSGYSLSQMAANSPPAVGSSAIPEGPQVAAASDGQERRHWAAPQSSTAPQATQDNRRQWTTPAPEPAKSSSPAKNGTSTLRLELKEQIDASELKQEECLGTGGFGAVYRGFFKGQEVAIKKLFCEDGGNISPLQLEELEKEVGALKSLKHPRLVEFIGASLQPPNLCIVTEYMAGGSLHHLLHKVKKTLTLSQQHRQAVQVAEGVDFLHRQRPPVVHRDLKSLNIVLDRQYNAKICDFGLTQSMENTHISLKEGGTGGSPRYMAPECYDSKGKITEKVDVWAVGCLLVEIYGGPLPYDDCTNIHQIVAKVLIEKALPYIPNHLPVGVRVIVMDCFQFDVSMRTTSQDVLRKLQNLKL